jgi:DNA-directed RNA polymerase specialized sigma24 family protein
LHRRIVLHIDTQVRERRTKVSIDDMVRLGYRVADKVSQQREYARFVVDEKRNQERNAILRERMEVVKAALAQLDEDEREILERFYLQEQSPEEIMREMHLTATQFRLHKSRAKAKFGQIGRMQMARESLKRRVG